jgi:hypothetical protein
MPTKKPSKKISKSKKKIIIKIPIEDEGLLSDYDYSLKNSHEDRVKAIKKSMKDNNLLKILRHLNALRTLHKSNEKLFNKLDKDLKWVQTEYKKIN